MSEQVTRERTPEAAAQDSAAEITRQARSNLAFTFVGVPRERRGDLVTFYAFCRVVDDIADNSSLALPDREQALDTWKRVLRGTTAPENELQREVVALVKARHLNPDLFIEVIAGCESDLHPQRFGTWEELQEYTYRVASAVGLACLPILGASPKASHYAITLGHALQLTNILRDVGEDIRNGGRIYLPLADLNRFQYTERDLVGGVHDGRFLALMNFEADRAEELFGEALASLPAPDRDALFSAELMRIIYHTLLQRMRSEGFHVFDRRYRLSKPRKLGILAREVIRRKFRKS